MTLDATYEFDCPGGPDLLSRSPADTGTLACPDLQRRKKSLPSCEVDHVRLAQGWSAELVLREARGSGDTENAMRRLEQRYGIPWRTFWSLRYRVPKTLCVTLWFKLRAAYVAECDRQARKLQHEIEITKAITGSGDPVVGAAEALVEAHYRADQEVR